MLDLEGRTHQWAGITLDMTAGKRAQEEQDRLQAALLHSEKMAAMGLLVAGVAHEVRNPLFAITATLDALEARYGTPKEYLPFLETLRGQAHRMSELMMALLEFGRPRPLELVPGSVGGILTQAAAACSFLAA